MALATEVAVIGAGPAGSTAALTLARHGIDTVLIEASTFGSFRIGETFAPEIADTLAPLGVLPRLETVRIDSYGVRSVWGDPEPQERSHLCHPRRVGWHVDRTAFDQALAQTASDAGAMLLTGTRFKSVEREGGRWRLTLQGQTDLLHAEQIIDATGRRAALSRRVGARRTEGDMLVATAFHFQDIALHDHGAYTLIETGPDGWWYSAPIPGGRAVAMHFSALEVAGRAVARMPTNAQAALTADRHADRSPVAMTRHAAGSSWLEANYGAGWIAVGDAAMTVDPMSGDGVERAVRSGREGAEALLLDRRINGKAVESWAAETRLRFERYARMRAEFYRAETRWADRPFWRWAHNL